MRAIIIGAGIGGLAAAVALRRIGVEALVLEQAPVIREAGAGLSIWSNAVNALRELGLEGSVMTCASVIEHNSVQTLSGHLIARSELGLLSSTAGAPCICIHRAALQRILLDALPAASVRTGARCAGHEDSTAILEGGERIEADFLVAADGIYSVIRDALHGSAPPRYAGYSCWRGIRSDNGVLPPRSTLLAMGAGSQFGLWHCGAGQLYWFLTKNGPPGTMQTKAEATALCRGWAAPIRETVAGTPENAILHNDIVDRAPLRGWWGRGRVTLLGDAAHASTPNLGQGACQALEDAVILAHCISEAGPVGAALRKYEQLRITRTTSIIRNSYQAGKILQLDSPALESFRNWFMGTRLSTYLSNRTFASLLTHKLPALHPRQ